MMRLAAVIGHPVAHSLSPVIHRAAFDAAGLDWVYAAFDVAPGAAADAVAAMRTLGIGGLSVTMPHKDGVAVAVDRLDDAARALGAVNTVSWDGEQLVGSSTDGAGFVGALEADGVMISGANCVVIGAGGAARAVIDSLGRAGAASIVVLNRTAAKADEAATLASRASVGRAGDITAADIVVNATSVGMGISRGSAAVSDLPCDPGLLRADTVAADLVYHPLETAWLAAARRHGARAIDGLGMLVHQAALQQQIWTGVLPDTAVMRSAAAAHLAATATDP
ncbi:MAG: shikimate dehydrogenase [Acidimicrobiia bacterium]|nr:shikimate dehydrogenase [Acidimicrobiia bacterium]